MKSYCVREKKQTLCVPGSERRTVASNGRNMMSCKCASCGITKTQFMKGQTALQSGGARVKGDYTCGLDPKKKPFSMSKCMEMKQVRYWGLKKIDSRILEGGSRPIAQQEEIRKNLISQKIVLNASIKKLRDEKKTYFNKLTPEQMAEINEKGQELVKQLKAVNTKIGKAEAAIAAAERKAEAAAKKTVKLPPMPKYETITDPTIHRRYKKLMKDTAAQKKKKKQKKRSPPAASHLGKQKVGKN